MGYCIFLRKGETHTVPIAGTKASDLAIGSIVKLNENGVHTDFIVVNQGIPENSNLYDSSCDGTWLLRKDIKENRAWSNSNSNIYETSVINTWLNNDYFNTLGNIEQKVIKQTKIPYCIGGGSSTINSGENGLSVKIFFLNVSEVGFRGGNSVPYDGAKLDYFESGTGTSAKNKRIANLNGSTSNWGLRSPNTNSSSSVWAIYPDGTKNNTGSNTSNGVRPALILPSTAKFDTDMKLIG